MQEIIAENRHFEKDQILLTTKISPYLLYNAMIRPVMAYVNVVWSSCDKHCLNLVLKLQKRAARIILDFYDMEIAKCCIIYKRLQGHVPAYLKSLL